MPYEKINNTPSPGAPDPSHVRVQWEHEREVQIAVLNPDSGFDWSMLNPIPTRYSSQGFTVEAPALAQQHEPAKFDGFWITLDRYNLNRLIRTLRRARDTAYGRDE